MADDYRQRVAEAILALLRRTVPSEYDLADAALAVPNPELERLRRQIATLDRLDKVAIDDWVQANRDLKAEVARLRAERDAARATRDETHVWTNTDWKERAGQACAERDELRELVRELADDGPCEYDQHGQCQGHSLHYKPCPHARAQELLATLGPKE